LTQNFAPRIKILGQFELIIDHEHAEIKLDWVDLILGLSENVTRFLVLKNLQNHVVKFADIFLLGSQLEVLDVGLD
jgi:hypothetical protein